MTEVKFTEREKYVLYTLVGKHRKELECEKYKIEAHSTYSEEETKRLEELRLLMNEANKLYEKINFMNVEKVKE